MEINRFFLPKIYIPQFLTNVETFMFLTKLNVFPFLAKIDSTNRAKGYATPRTFLIENKFARNFLRK